MHSLSQDALGEISEEMEAVDNEDDDIFTKDCDGEVKKSSDGEDGGVNGSGTDQQDGKSRNLNTEENRVQKRDRSEDEEVVRNTEGIKMIRTDEDLLVPGSEGDDRGDVGDQNSTVERGHDNVTAITSDEESTRKRGRVNSEGTGEGNSAVVEEAPKEKRQKMSGKFNTHKLGVLLIDGIQN